MLSNIIRGEYVTEVRYELAFDDGHGNGYGFPCDANGVVDEGLTPDALRNLEYCRQHPDAFKRANTNLNLNCNHLRASFPLCRCLAAVNDALHRLPPLGLGRAKNLLRICSLLD